MFLRIVPFIGALVALILAIIFTKLVNRKSRGNKRMQEISDAIFIGSRAYLNQQARIMIKIGKTFLKSSFSAAGAAAAVVVLISPHDR